MLLTHSTHGWAQEQSDGLIAFTTVTTSGPQIHVMRADGTKRTPVRHGLHPAWSPQGRQIVYATVDDASSDIAVMNVDGTDSHRLTKDGNVDVQPSWSPDGTRIAFVSTAEANADLYIVAAGGGRPRRLTQDAGGDLHPAWSPDGTRIAFTSTRDSGAGIYSMRADGTGVIRLSTSALDWGPAWSPDGTRIAFASSRNGASEIYVMTKIGSGERRMTSIAGADDPSWAPDGRRIVFSRGLDLYVLDIESSKTSRLTTDMRETDPAWQPRAAEAATLSDVGVVPRGADSRPDRPVTRVLGVTGTAEAPNRASGAATAPSEGRSKATVSAPVRAEAHERSSLSASVHKPSELRFDARAVLASSVGMALILLLVFPTNVFSNTFEEHYDEIMAWFGRQRSRRPPGRSSAARRWLALGAMGVVTALLNGFLDPQFGFDRASLVLVLSVVALFVLLALLRLGQIAYMNRESPGRTHARVFPGALAIAALGVGISRMLAFQPGYLFGNLTGTASAGPVGTRDEGRAQALGLGAALVSAFAAWGLWNLVVDAARRPRPSTLVLVADAFLAACFVGGLGSVFFALIPIRWLEGYDVLRYNRWLWIGLAAPTTFAFVHVLLQPSQGAGGAMALPLILFTAFGLASVAFWAYFRFRTTPRPADQPTVPLSPKPVRPPGPDAAPARSGKRRPRGVLGSSSRA